MDVTRPEVLKALGLAAVMGIVFALIAVLFDNPPVGSGIAGAIAAFVGRLGFYSSRNLKAMSGPKPDPLEGQQLD
jgi:xanthosine utilization system XapX-like protein